MITSFYRIILGCLLSVGCSVALAEGAANPTPEGDTMYEETGQEADTTREPASVDPVDPQSPSQTAPETRSPDEVREPASIPGETEDFGTETDTMGDDMDDMGVDEDDDEDTVFDPGTVPE